MISILIPTYNYNIVPLVEELHRQTIASKIPFEIIVVDDCSTEQKIQLENQSIAKREQCFYLENKVNQGRTATRNILATKAKYNWLLFLDADVMLDSKEFIESYINSIKNSSADVIFGGVCYQKEQPKKEEILRWHYGKNREVKSVNKRTKNPYFIISQNLLIQKRVFKKANVINENFYGLDNIFSNMLKKIDAKILHIHNPVLHLGLEKASVFLSKSLKSVETTVYFENNNQLDIERPLQKTYVTFKSYGILPVLRMTIKLFEKQLLSNFKSKNPSLFLFDLYRLYYYDKLKRNA
ncbi:glycosyltransferase family 2 protein [Marixanthomonas sp. SCSIO 43207]|uniref:glycosyltransferase family 2 protein n=1 Tax=Marixanthomonas sp. SCSIO 43207 TaxID=2779360 RepID=UPI001CAA2D9E|nr:glycosyltransferase family 2 protein [Marixanthomonas sp. SCSIO 43207]UAB80121.1 glycosyltransferase family 2 protein [Marixanthomonas sp. SCSIO 43207]